MPGWKKLFHHSLHCPSVSIALQNQPHQTCHKQSITSAEVAAAKAKKAQLLQRLDELNKQNKFALAEMEINKEEEEAHEEWTVVWCIEDLPEAHNEVCPVHPVEPRDDELEEFPMDEHEPLNIQDKRDEPIHLEGEHIDVQIQPVSWMLPYGFMTNYNNRWRGRRSLPKERQGRP